MARLKFNIHIRTILNFDEHNFINQVRNSIDSVECGTKTCGIQYVSDKTDPFGYTEKVYECIVETQGTRIPGVETSALIFGDLMGNLRGNSTFELLGIPLEEMELFS